MSHWSLKHAASGEPDVEPVSTAEAKSWSRIDTSADDTLIGTLITGARLRFESDARRSCITQTWEYYLDRFPSDDEAIELPRPPVQSVSSITYTDENGDSQTWSSSDYSLDSVSQPARVYPAYDETYPETQDIRNAVKITYVAGYGDAGSDVPQDVRNAILMLVAHWYEHRETVSLGIEAREVPMAYNYIVNSLRCWP